MGDLFVRSHLIGRRSRNRIAVTGRSHGTLKGKSFWHRAITATLAWSRLWPLKWSSAGGTIPAIDEYFARFRAAELKVGVCIRPQKIAMLDGKPVQQAADDEHAVQILKEKIAYAKQRWNCTLFYVDSTATVSGSLNPDVFKSLAEAYPDVLLIPENESMRYFAYSAPLNSYVHHKVTSTPAGARMVYPKAFSVLMAPEGDRPEDHDALVTAVRHGDILLFNGWYNNDGVIKIKKLYGEATLEHPVATLKSHRN